MLKRKRLIAFFSFLLIVLILFVTFIKQQYVVPILMYHSVNPQGGGTENRLAVSVNTFERQMQFLKKHRYNVLPLEALVDLIKEKKKIPPHSVAITLDDGYRDNYTCAFPILKKYNLPATVFIIVREVDRPQGDRLSWDELKVMLDSGIITLGSHSIGPDPLIKAASEEDLKKEIFDSKRILEEKLGQRVNLFSYPEGRFTPEIRQLVMDAGYKAAVGTSPGRNYPDDDIFALKRLRISESAKNLGVFWIETSGFYTFIKEHRDED